MLIHPVKGAVVLLVAEDEFVGLCGHEDVGVCEMRALIRRISRRINRMPSLPKRRLLINIAGIKVILLRLMLIRVNRP